MTRVETKAHLIRISGGVCVIKIAGSEGGIEIISGCKGTVTTYFALLGFAAWQSTGLTVLWGSLLCGQSTVKLYGFEGVPSHITADFGPPPRKFTSFVWG